jgi:hypothetical protein
MWTKCCPIDRNERRKLPAAMGREIVHGKSDDMLRAQEHRVRVNSVEVCLSFAHIRETYAQQHAICSQDAETFGEHKWSKTIGIYKLLDVVNLRSLKFPPIPIRLECCGVPLDNMK